jgi:hypothetical protein
MEKERSTEFFSVISDIEGDAAFLEEVIDSLYLFEEALRNAVEWLDPLKPYTVELFTKRFHLLSGMLNILQRELGQHNAALRADITKAYRLQAESRRQETI